VILDTRKVVRMKKLMLVVMILGLTSLSWGDQTKTDVDDRLDSAAKTLQEIMNTPDKGIPEEVFEGAKCVAVVPSMIKGGFIFGGKHGRGVATCKLPNGSWSAPAFFTITGGSWGAQIGVEDVSLVMMVMNDDGMRHLLQDKFQIGGSASASAGPVGRHASAGTGWKLNSEILTYSRSRGLFAGIDLGGSEIERDGDSTKAMYGKDLTNTTVLTGKVRVPAAAHTFVAAVEHAKAEAKKQS
jgi:lipid-binding SYLF domain-containing protein